MPNNACPFPKTTKKVKNFGCYFAHFLLYTCQIVALLFGYTLLV